MFSFYLFRKYFFSSRSTSLIRSVAWICFFGLAVSVAALILVVSIMGGLGESITDRLLLNKPHLVFPLKKNPFTKRGKFQLPPYLRDGVKSQMLYETQDFILQTADGFTGGVAKGYGVADWEREKKLSLSSLIPFDESEVPEVLISDEVSFQLNLYETDRAYWVSVFSLFLPPTETLFLKKVYISGVLTSSGSESVFYKQGEVDFGDFSQISYGAELKLHNPYNTEPYKALGAETWQERNSDLFFALRLEKFLMVLFITFGILISCLGVSSALFLLMAQKGRDIGVFQAIGLSKKELQPLFVRVGFYLAFFGVLFGVLIGLGGVAFFKYTQWNFLPEMYEDRTIPAVFDSVAYAWIVLGSLLLSWLACYVPVRYISRMNLIELLKFTNK